MLAPEGIGIRECHKIRIEDALAAEQRLGAVLLTLETQYLSRNNYIASKVSWSCDTQYYTGIA